MTVAKVNAGAANVADSLNSVVQVGNAQLAILTAQQSLRAANAALTRLVGTPYLVTAHAVRHGRPRVAPIDSATLMGLALDGPAIRQNAGADQRRRSASIESAKTAYFPTLSAVRELRRQRRVGVLRLRQQSVSVHTQRRASA